MNVLVKILIVFDLLCFGVYFGGDILSTALAKLRKKPAQKELFEFYEEDADTPLSVDSIRQLYSGEVDTFVEEKLLPDGESTAEVLTERELAAARLLLRALVGLLVEEAPMEERSFPMLMELLNHAEGEKEDGCQDPVDLLMEDFMRRPRRYAEYYGDYQHYQLMQVDKERVILACRIRVNGLLGELYRYDYRFGYDLLLTDENSLERKLHKGLQEEWEDEEYEIGDC